MNMKKSVKIVATLLLAIVLVSTISTTCFATKVGDITINKGTDQFDKSDFKGKLETVITTLRSVAAIVGVIVITILGIKYMMGSVEEKAEYKKSFVPLVVGIVVVVAALQIAAFIFQFAA